MSGDTTSHALRGRIGGLRRAAMYDGPTVTAKARAAFAASFVDGHQCSVCPPSIIPVDLPEKERARRAVALRAEHFARLAYRSAQARRKVAA